MPICLMPCHCYISSNPLCLCCESKIHTSISQWVWAQAHLEFFYRRCFLHFLLLLQSMLHQIGPLHTNWLFTLQFVMLQPPPMLFLWLYFLPSPFTLLYYALLILCQEKLTQDFQILNKSHYMWSKIIH
jgi:hypothetical protein